MAKLIVVFLGSWALVSALILAFYHASGKTKLSLLKVAMFGMTTAIVSTITLTTLVYLF